MGIRKRTYFIAVCDECKYEFENSDGGTQGFDKKKEVKETVINECGWTVDHGKLICPWCVENMA